MLQGLDDESHRGLLRHRPCRTLIFIDHGSFCLLLVVFFVVMEQRREAAPFDHVMQLRLAVRHVMIGGDLAVGVAEEVADQRERFASEGQRAADGMSDGVRPNRFHAGLKTQPAQPERQTARRQGALRAHGQEPRRKRSTRRWDSTFPTWTLTPSHAMAGRSSGRARRFALPLRLVARRRVLASNTACFSGPGEDVSLLVLAFNARASALSLYARLPAGKDVRRYQYAHGVPAWQRPAKLALVRRPAPCWANLDDSDGVTQVVAVDATAQQDEEAIFTLDGESAAPGDERSGNWVLWTGLVGDQRRRLIGYNLVTGRALDLPDISERCLGLRATVSSSDAHVALQCGYYPGETLDADVFDVATGQVVDAIGAAGGGQLLVSPDWLRASTNGEQLLVWESAPPEGRPPLRAFDVRTGAATFRIVLNGWCDGVRANANGAATGGAPGENRTSTAA